MAIALDAVLGEATSTRSTKGPVALSGRDVISGDQTIPLSVELATADVGQGATSVSGRPAPVGRVKVLRLRIAGTSSVDFGAGEPSPYTATPSLLDGAGVPMRLIFANPACSKDAAGQIREGETLLEYYLEDSLRLETVTLILGSPSRVLHGNWSASLRPIEQK